MTFAIIALLVYVLGVAGTCWLLNRDLGEDWWFAAKSCLLWPLWFAALVAWYLVVRRFHRVRWP